MAWNIDLNRAGADELQKFPFIGPQFAELIVRFRQEHGLFKNWDDVKKIPGIPDSLVDDLKEQGFTLGKKAA